MKASNPKVMIECHWLLVARLAELGRDWNSPLHPGVTEAGEGKDGRSKSAIGIGSLLGDGLGDTIRVSLTEDSPQEIPVCADLIALTFQLTHVPASPGQFMAQEPPFDPFTFQRRPAREVTLSSDLKCDGEQTVRVIVARAVADVIAPKSDLRPEGVLEDLDLLEVDPNTAFQVEPGSQFVTVKDGIRQPEITEHRQGARRRCQGKRAPAPRVAFTAGWGNTC